MKKRMFIGIVMLLLLTSIVAAQDFNQDGYTRTVWPGTFERLTFSILQRGDSYCSNIGEAVMYNDGYSVERWPCPSGTECSDDPTTNTATCLASGSCLPSTTDWYCIGTKERCRAVRDTSCNLEASCQDALSWQVCSLGEFEAREILTESAYCSKYSSERIIKYTTYNDGEAVTESLRCLDGHVCVEPTESKAYCDLVDPIGAITTGLGDISDTPEGREHLAEEQATAQLKLDCEQDPTNVECLKLLKDDPLALLSMVPGWIWAVLLVGGAVFVFRKAKGSVGTVVGFGVALFLILIPDPVTTMAGVGLLIWSAKRLMK